MEKRAGITRRWSGELRHPTIRKIVARVSRNDSIPFSASTSPLYKMRSRVIFGYKYTFWDDIGAFSYSTLHCLIYDLGLPGSSGPWARILRVQYLWPYINPVNTKHGYKYNILIRHTHVSSPRDFIRFIESDEISNPKLFFITYIESMTQLL